MAFDWLEYHLLADELRARGGEACARSAISRVYYSMYCQARNNLIDLGEDEYALKQPHSHKLLWRKYRERGRTFAPIGVNGSRLHENRLQADYENEISNVSKLLDESFEYAAKVTFYLNQVRSATRRS